MPSDFAFRLSTYLTLALSCVCLGYSEWDLLPESGVLAVVVLVLLAVSFRSGTRYELDLQSANRVGLVIGLLAAGWMAYQFVNKNSLIYTLPWPASLLPYLGPLLMVLMPAKLFRPKHVGDWWAMQGIALAGVGLASSMAEDEVFGVLLGLYAVAGVTSLTLFFYRRAAGALPPIPHTDPGPSPGGGGRRGRTLRASGRARPGLAGAGRGDWPAAVLPDPPFAGPEVAVRQDPGGRVAVRPVGGPERDRRPRGEPGGRVLRPGDATRTTGRRTTFRHDQRWRAYALSHYDGGRWTTSEASTASPVGGGHCC